MKKAILAVSYGTAYPDALISSIEATENAFREAFPEYTVRRAFTGKQIMEMLEKKNIHVDSVEEALSKLADEGFEEIIVQPTHIINGSEYDKISAVVEAVQYRFCTVKIGSPLLHNASDIEMLCRFFAAEYRNTSDALLLMGHGSDHHANKLYTDFANICCSLGYSNLFIATLEALPSIDDVISLMKDAGYKSVTITPLLFVAGGHAWKNMAGDQPDSWKSRLEAEGFSVTAIVKGLGEYPEIRELYTKHLRNAIKK